MRSGASAGADPGSRILWVGDAVFVDPPPGAVRVEAGEFPAEASPDTTVVIVADWPSPGAMRSFDRAIALRVPAVVIGRASGDVGQLRRAVTLGASAVLRGRVSPGTLRAALDAVAHGQVVLCPEVLDVAAVSRRGMRSGCILSDREQEVMSLVVLGHTNSEIAAALHIAEKTVKNHLNRIFSRLDVATRTAAVAAYLGLVPTTGWRDRVDRTGLTGPG